VILIGAFISATNVDGLIKDYVYHLLHLHNDVLPNQIIAIFIKKFPKEEAFQLLVFSFLEYHLIIQGLKFTL
jgi:hypothetical protein